MEGCVCVLAHLCINPSLWTHIGLGVVLLKKRYRQGKECARMNLNNQQDDAWSPNKMSLYINVKMSIYTPEVRTKWVELQLNGEYIYIWLKSISMTNSKFSWWNGGETETSRRAGYWRNSEPVSSCTLQQRWVAGHGLCTSDFVFQGRKQGGEYVPSVSDWFQGVLWRQTRWGKKVIEVT